MKKGLYLAYILLLSIALNSCSVFSESIDKKTGFTGYLEEAKKQIREESWKNAEDLFNKANKAWNSIKPVMQIDVDHDYLLDIDRNMVLLKAYIETKNRSEAIAVLMMIEISWKDIKIM